MNHPFTPPEREDDPRYPEPTHEVLNAAIRKDEAPARYTERCVWEARVAELVADAEAMGWRVTIENKSDQPPAMRNYHPIIHVYESRK